MARVLVLTVAYDGAGFAGSQRQAGARSVQEELERALTELFGERAWIVLAGRTDRGVHAAGQVASCKDGRPDLSDEAVRRRLNATLPDDLAVVAVERRPWGFHARYDATWREYRYRIWSGVPQPLARPLVWQRAERLDVAAMDRAAGKLVGEHDVAALAGGGAGVPWSAQRERARGTVRNVLRCGCRVIEPWWGAPDSAGTLTELRIVADGFLPRMVRTIAATLVEVGRGARPEAWVDELLATRDRRSGPGTAPPHGLIFWRVGYGDELPDPDPDEPDERKGA